MKMVEVAVVSTSENLLQVGAGHAKAFIRKHEGWAGEDAYFCATNE